MQSQIDLDKGRMAQLEKTLSNFKEAVTSFVENRTITPDTLSYCREELEIALSKAKAELHSETCSILMTNMDVEEISRLREKVIKLQKRIGKLTRWVRGKFAKLIV